MLRRPFVIGCALVGLLTAAAADVAAQPLFGATQDPLAGARVFGAKGCARCHAINGVGGSGGPDLGRTARPRSFHDLAATLWNHARGMAVRMRDLGVPRPQFDATEMGDLVAFLFTVDYFDPPADVQVGRKLFAAKRCIVCHQVGDIGGVIGPSLDAKPRESPLSLAAAMWNHGPQMAATMKARGIERPTFQATELRDLLAFVNSRASRGGDGSVVVLPGRATEGRRLFIERRCALCHSGEGRTAPDLPERVANRSLTEFAAAMWNKAPAMTDALRQRGIGLPQLTATEMADLVAYLYSLRYVSRAGDPGAGVRVIVQKGCLGCHALHGERGKPASDLAKSPGTATPAAVMAALWNHSFIANRPREREPAWPSLTADEMQDLMAFLAALRMRAR